jgi:hypothetical protein
MSTEYNAHAAAAEFGFNSVAVGYEIAQHRWRPGPAQIVHEQVFSRRTGRPNAFARPVEGNLCTGRSPEGRRTTRDHPIQRQDVQHQLAEGMIISAGTLLLGVNPWASTVAERARRPWLSLSLKASRKPVRARERDRLP